jgi:xanthine dehydrogenase small subunit
MNCVRFILDGELVEIENPDPTRTVLQYLREDLRRTGSKEGCAEGDCGACTVVVGQIVDSLAGQRIQFRSVNACIQFLPTLDGKMLFTVESLKTVQGQLHPVQQSLVDCHASQCGFCTPGFVMSMFALYKTKANIDRLSVDDALSGNLCRCTGYRPIIDACLSMTDYPVPENSNPLIFESAENRGNGISDQEQQAIDQLRRLERSDGLTLKIGQRHYHAPNSVNELAQIYADSPNAQILAGGTDVGLWVTKQLRQLDDIIYLGHIDELNKIEQSNSFIKIGAAVSLTDAFDALSEHYPELYQLFRRFSSVPVRNAATLVGNIANGSPIGDSMPALICMGARVALRQGKQSREMELQDFYIDYQKNVLQAGEFIEAVLVPVKDTSWQLRSYKLSKRYDQDISAVCATFSIQLEAGKDDSKIVDIRIAFGGMAAIPKRATQTEAILKGQLWNEDSVHQAMAALSRDFSPLSDMRASQDYRQQTAANLLYRFYLETRQNGALTEHQLDVFVDHAAVHR